MKGLGLPAFDMGDLHVVVALVFDLIDRIERVENHFSVVLDLFVVDVLRKIEVFLGLKSPLLHLHSLQ